MTLTIGKFEIDYDSNDNYVVRDRNDSDVMTYNTTTWSIPVPLSTTSIQSADNVGEIIDSGENASESVTAAGTTTIQCSNATDATMRVLAESVIVWAPTDPGSAFGLDISAPRYNGTNWEFDVTETEGSTSVTFNWRLLGVPN